MGVTRQRLEMRGTRLETARQARYDKGNRPKKTNRSKGFILILCIGVFFSIPFASFAVGFKDYDPMEEVALIVKKADVASSIPAPEKEAEDIAEKINPEVVDPLKRIEKVASKEEIISLKSPVTVPASKKGNGNTSQYSSLLLGYPMAAMADALSKEKSEVATFLIAIAKKESDWGNHAPRKDGKDCYNYWGYKGSYDLTESGYSCFDSPEQAVSVVGGRIGELIGKNIDTPAKMVVWKCGSSCSGHDPASVEKWISDVDIYFRKLNSKQRP